MGDCVADKNEFKGKEATDSITFEKTFSETYKPANWNAVILYNYVHESINWDVLPKYNSYYKYASDVKGVLKKRVSL